MRRYKMSICLTESQLGCSYLLGSWQGGIGLGPQYWYDIDGKA